MKKISRNFVSISLALVLFGGISGLVFAQETAEEAPEPTRWSAPSVTIGTGTFKIDVQTVFNGFLVTTPTKTYDETNDKLVDAGDTTIEEYDDEDYTGKISLSAEYDNSDAEGVGYSFGVGGGIRRVNNFDGEFEGYFDNPWGKLWLLNKQLWLRVGGPEDPWTAWDDNWSYGNDPSGAVQLNINPTALKGLNIGVTLPIPKDESKADYPFKNMVIGFKLGEPLPYTTISAALKLREPGVGTPSALTDSIDLNAALDFNFSPVQIRAEIQIADLNQDTDDLKAVIIGDDSRSTNFQLHPRFDLSLSKLVDLGAFSLETFTVYAWIKSDPLYVSDGNSNTELSIEWAPSYKLLEAGNTTLTASVFFGGYFNVWGGDATKEKQALEDTYAYNQLGFTVRPALEFKFGPNAGIRLRDRIRIQQTGVSPELGIDNQVQVKFWWGL